MMTSTTADDGHHALEAAQLADHVGRGDLAARLRTATARVSRPGTVVCVVGEFKQGKSSLINAMLGEPVCPVDDDLATSALTFVHHGASVGAQVRYRSGGTGSSRPSIRIRSPTG